MTTTPDGTEVPVIRQSIFGTEARVAGGNYFEFSHTASASHLLETAPMEELDEIAVENERLFIRRFGTDVPRDARVGVIAIKRAYGFVDSEPVNETGC